MIFDPVDRAGNACIAYGLAGLAVLVAWALIGAAV